MVMLHYFPSVRPSALVAGTAFNNLSALAVLAPLFGDTYRRARAADSREEFLRSREAAGTAVGLSTALAGAAAQAYGVAALLNATGVATARGAATLGSLVFLASAAPGIISQVVLDKRPIDTVAVGALTRIFETVGLALFLNWFGTSTHNLL